MLRDEKVNAIYWKNFNFAVMKASDLQAIYKQAVQQSLSFVCYRLPGEKQIFHAMNADGKLVKSAELVEMAADAHFIFAPFHAANAAVFVMPLTTNKQEAGKMIDVYQPEKPAKAANKQVYMDLVDSMKSAINEGLYDKLVASRIIMDEKPTTFSAALLFESLCTKYPNAFVYWIFIPGETEWLGASPEQLLKSEQGKIYTMSLAGSQAFVEGQASYHWGEKEQKEQEIVSNYIFHTMMASGVTALKMSDAQTHRAGNMIHLRTDISAEIDSVNDLLSLIFHLHPTPAVCGLPKEKAMQYILDHEMHDRKYYSGFLGIIGKEMNCNLFVNLRCMEITQNQLIRYVGCGITADSNAELEWEESVHKSQTLGRVIDELFPQN